MKCLSLAAILVPMWARVACFKGKHAEDVIETAPQKPQIAVMIVGRLFKLTPEGGEVQAAFSQDAGNKNLLEMMTEDDHDDPLGTKDSKEKQERTEVDDTLLANQTTPLLSFPYFNPGIWPEMGSPNVWENTKARLLNSLSRFGDVHIYVCVDPGAWEGTKSRSHGLLVPPEITKVFEFNFVDINQYGRSAECVRRIKQMGVQYDWWIKKRPDFFSYQDWPDVTKFNPDYLYTRFRFVAGIKGLTSHVMSWDYCQPTCNGGKPGAKGHGYVNDDMLLVASSKLIDHVFLPGRPAPAPPVFAGDMWVPPGCWECYYSQQLLSNHILTMPLSLAGCPLNTPYPHCQRSYPCAKAGMPLDCGPGSITIDHLHKRMFSPRTSWP